MFSFISPVRIIAIIWKLISLPCSTSRYSPRFSGYFYSAALGAGTYQALNYWIIRRQDYATITYTQINQSISGNVSKLFFGILGFGSLGLLLGQVISSTSGVGLFVKKIRLSDRNSFSSISFSGLKRVAREYRDFPLFSGTGKSDFTTIHAIPHIFHILIVRG